MWHYKLGHPHHEALKVALSLCNIAIPNKTIADFCFACCLGKVHRLSSHASTIVYTSTFDLYCNLWGSDPVASSCGYHYLLTCADALTKYTWIFALKLKSNTLFLLILRNLLKLMVLGPYFAKHGIVLCLTHTPITKMVQLNKKHSYVVETGLTLLAQASLPLDFWDHALLTTT
ncbi:hypothetical protein CR513_18292, partial [Mucuna pruriens]